MFRGVNEVLEKFISMHFNHIKVGKVILKLGINKVGTIAV